eukprot:CAMPEP_0197073372 /NCGR_PEP_ID=MMETSP1384-20130603/210572_1 /TAXON_ID=29189 /ORGANISM="Ammonia sp." /LENGTH=338 /DNA_ID=CAMNT_0042512209 /DNA_START=198 /DNA_END=1214 /DNA_ORIENTATION=+
MAMIPTEYQPIFEEISQLYVDEYVTEPYKSEMEYFSNCSGLSMKDIMTVNLAYDMTVLCTSIVAVTPNGTILHARNFDFPTVLRNDSVNLKFVDGATGDMLYEVTTFVGWVGAATVMRPHQFSITIDEHVKVENPDENFKAMKQGYFPSSWLLREAAMKDATFADAVDRLSNTKIVAPAYYIIAGTDGSMDGAIITRNQTHVNGPWNVTAKTEFERPLYLTASPHDWYLVETNYDYWRPTPEFERPLYLTASPHDWYLVETNYDYWRPTPTDDQRREAAIAMLDAVGQENISYDTLFNILSTPPVLQPYTVFTSLVHPSNPDEYNITVRYNTASNEVL